MRSGSSMVFVVLLSSFLLIGVWAEIASFLLTLTSTTVETLPTEMPTLPLRPKSRRRFRSWFLPGMIPSRRPGFLLNMIERLVS